MAQRGKMSEDEFFYCDECLGWGLKNDLQAIEGHKKRHELLVYGFKIRKTENDKTIFQDQDYWMTLVTPLSSLSQRNKAAKASSAASKSLARSDFSYSSYRAKDTNPKDDLSLFLIHNGNRVVGLVVCKKKQCLKVTWDGDNLANTSEITESPIWIVDMIWVAVSYQKKGLARKAINAIIDYLSIDKLGWSCPFSDSGEKLIKKLHPEQLYIYYSG
jgi:hypothetical protein